MLSLASARQTDKFSHVVMSGLKDCHNTNHCQLIHGGRRDRGQGLPGHCNVGSRSLSTLQSPELRSDTVSGQIQEESLCPLCHAAVHMCSVMCHLILLRSEKFEEK